MIYLDNAATTYPKPERVYNAVLDCMKIIVQIQVEQAINLL